jgi:hypothetical protein
MTVTGILLLWAAASFGACIGYMIGARRHPQMHAGCENPPITPGTPSARKALLIEWSKSHQCAGCRDRKGCKASRDAMFEIAVIDTAMRIHQPSKVQ